MVVKVARIPRLMRACRKISDPRHEPSLHGHCQVKSDDARNQDAVVHYRGLVLEIVMKNSFLAASFALSLSMGLMGCAGSAANDQADSDADGLTDTAEAALKTDPNNADTDDDGALDGEEVHAKTDPRAWDTDKDGVEDGREFHNGTNPRNRDSNGDGIGDGDEDHDGNGVCERDEPWHHHGHQFDGDGGARPDGSWHGPEGDAGFPGRDEGEHWGGAPGASGTGTPPQAPPDFDHDFGDAGAPPFGEGHGFGGGQAPGAPSAGQGGVPPEGHTGEWDRDGGASFHR